VEANVWIFLSTKFVNRPWLTGLTPDLFSRYTDHFLGKKVAELVVPSVDNPTGDDQHAVRPPWHIVLSYECECRKKAFRLVTEEGYSLREALPLVVKDSELKELYFTTPLALMARTRDAPPRALAREAKTPRTSSWSGKGAKGKGKGGGKRKPQNELAFRTPDKRFICSPTTTRPKPARASATWFMSAATRTAWESTQCMSAPSTRRGPGKRTPEPRWSRRQHRGALVL